MLLKLLSYLLVIQALFVLDASADCKSKPGCPSWPNPSQWDTLNKTTRGHLLKTVAPGGVCHPGEANYALGQCNQTAIAWTTESFHAQNPFSFMYNDDACYPNIKAPCSVDGYPVYVVDARTASDVLAAVNFARSHNIRVVVKGTGHDYNFRSNAPNSLRIWTHNMQEAKFLDAFVPQGSNATPSASPTTAVTLSAGMQWGPVYSQAAAHGVEVVGGSDPTVGVMGLLLGGGHGPLSAQRGLAADQALEFLVITPDGQLRTCNAYQNVDLFWALRGGGGSTFAVVVSMTVKTFPMQNVTTYSFQTNSTNNNALWDASTYFSSQLPQLNEAGMTCYFYVTPAVSGSGTVGSLYGIFISYGSNNATQVSLLTPLINGMRAGSWKNSTTPFGGISNEYPNLYAYTTGSKTTDVVGLDGRLGSRLLTEESLTSDMGRLRSALEASTPPGATMMGHMTAGKGVREVKPEGGGNAVLPAWRYSYVHLVQSTNWYLTNTTQKDQYTSNLLNVREAALKELAPNTGSYMSEGDPTDPDWQSTFWGANYPALLALKKKYDPNAMFYCKPCVGSELFVEQNGVVCTLDGSAHFSNGMMNTGNSTTSEGNC